MRSRHLCCSLIAETLTYDSTTGCLGVKAFSNPRYALGTANDDVQCLTGFCHISIEVVFVLNFLLSCSRLAFSLSSSSSFLHRLSFQIKITK